MNEVEIRYFRLRERYENIIVISLCIGFFIAGYCVYSLQNSIGSPTIKISLNGTNCSTGDIISDSKCLNKEFNGFFYYNISRITQKLSEGEFVSGGGVCWHASAWYEKRMSERGYYTKYVNIKTNESMNHEFLVASNNIAYCILDQRTVYCSRFAG